MNDQPIDQSHKNKTNNISACASKENTDAGSKLCKYRDANRSKQYIYDVPRLPPKADSTKKMANVCMVKGTVVGILIQEQIAIRTAPSAM